MTTCQQKQWDKKFDFVQCRRKNNLEAVSSVKFYSDKIFLWAPLEGVENIKIHDTSLFANPKVSENPSILVIFFASPKLHQIFPQCLHNYLN